MGIVIDGRSAAKEIREQVKQSVDILKKHNVTPKMAVIEVGNDPASFVYSRKKSKACEETGIEQEEYILPEDTQMSELVLLINELNNRKDIHGILLLSPVPQELDIYKAFGAIDYKKDIDGFNPINIGRLALNKKTFISCTAQSVVKLLEINNIKLDGANVVILGRSNIVGKPLAQYLLNKDATVTVCHHKTKNLEEITKKADIVVSAIGKPKIVKADMIKEGAVVIDVGMNEVNGKLIGDVDFDNVKDKASYITPVPGGVGPVTVAMLLHNIVIAAQYSEKNIKELKI